MAMSPRVPPLEPELDDLLEVERRAPAPDDALARVWSRVAVPPPLPPLQGGAAGPRRSGFAAAVSSRGPLVLASVVAGMVLGAGMHALLRPAVPARVVFVDRPVPAAAPAVVAPSAAGATASAIEPESEPVAESPVRRSAPARGVPATHAASTIAEERALLEQARAALALRDGPGALRLTDEHARRFARPQLGEEREAIAIQALVLAGRHVEARDRAALFEARSPDSLFRPAVEASLASIP
jgi:hypothetical protein